MTNLRVLFMALAMVHVASSVSTDPPSNTTTPTSPVNPNPPTNASTTTHSSPTSATIHSATPTSSPGPTVKSSTAGGTTEIATMTTNSTGTSEEPLTTAMTTEMVVTTSTMSTMSPYRVGTWSVQDSQNNTCMMMSFNGTISLKDGEKRVSVGIPDFADASESSCADDEHQPEFKLVFDDDKYGSFSVKLQFLLQDQYTYLYGADISKAAKSDGSENLVLFQTPVGMSFQCDKQTIRVGEFNLTMSDMKLQPFSMSAKDKEFGAAYSCNPSSPPNAALITGLVLGAIIFILLIALWMSRRKKHPGGRGPRYENFT